MAVTLEEIKHIASLAKLSFTEAELLRFQREFTEIVNYISQIKECDTKGIEFEHNLADNTASVLHNDTVIVSLPREKVLQNATNRSKNGYIKTSKIVTKE